jgi:hypothetical protein
LHTFRHTGATFLANDASVPLIQLKRLLGHRSVKTTEIYLHAQAEDLARTVRRVDFTALAGNSKGDGGAGTGGGPGEAIASETVNGQASRSA